MNSCNYLFFYAFFAANPSGLFVFYGLLQSPHLTADEPLARYLFFVSQSYAFAICRPLQQALRARGDEAAWFFEHDPDAHYLRADELRLTTAREAVQWNSAAIFVPGNWVPHFFPGLKVEVFHGFSVGKRGESKGHFRIRGSFDLYCTHGPDTTRPFEQLAKDYGYFRVRETGWPKLDPLFSGALTAPQNRSPTILYASTFTESISSARVLHPLIAQLSSTDRWRWLVTLHPKMAPDVVASYKALQSPHLQFVETDDILSLYAQADVMLSDTSSVVPEFLTQHKPVVTFRNRKPGPHLINIENLNDVQPALECAFAPSAELQAAIVRYADHIHPYRDGRSSERVLAATDEAIQRGSLGLRRKPLNLWRRLQARKRLSYWS
jgi:CDP-Glycerol:Poly(glycerophosphate) glycerophosphotransferase